MANISTLLSAKFAPFAPPSLAPSLVTNSTGLITIPHCASMMNNATTCFSVGEAPAYATSFMYMQCAGQCCLFTVPSGITEVQFQIWGAGGGGSVCQHGTCCSFSPGGGSGEYTYIRMAATAGQTYTLCAGGGTGICCGQCYCSTPGCASFVCGSNSTCIVACGGSSSLSTNGLYNCYPDSYSSACSNINCSQTYIATNSGGGALPFSKVAARGPFCCNPVDTVHIQIAKTTNNINMLAQVPSLLGAVHQCGIGLCYMAYMVPAIHCDHTIRMVCTGYVGYTETAAAVNGQPGTGCLNFNPAFNFPGAGGPASIHACFCGTQFCGNRARSGSILVRMR